MFEKIIKSVSYLRTLFLDCLFPIECIGCKSDGEWFCDNCFSKIKYNDKQNCPVCKIGNLKGEVCDKCRSKTNLDGIIIACDYGDKTISSLIKIYKYKFIKDIGESLGRILCNYIKEHTDIITSSDLVIIPVPLHKRRSKWRGFNQAEILSRIIACEFNIQINTSLIKIKHTKPQAMLDREGRLANVVGSYKWIGEKMNAKNVIMVDDVATTGATLGECAKELKANGAKSVWGFVIAKN